MQYKVNGYLQLLLRPVHPNIDESVIVKILHVNTFNTTSAELIVQSTGSPNVSMGIFGDELLVLKMYDRRICQHHCKTRAAAD